MRLKQNYEYNGILRDIQDFNCQELKRKGKSFDPLRMYSEQIDLKKCSNPIDEHKNAIEHSYSVMREMYSKSKNLAEENCEDKVKKLKGEKREIEKEIARKTLKLELKDNEKQQFQKEIKEIDAKIEKEIKAETDKIFGQMLALYKTFETIKETSKLTEKQFKQNLIVAGTQWVYGSFGKVDQGVQDLVKTLMKLLAEQKI